MKQTANVDGEIVQASQLWSLHPDGPTTKEQARQIYERMLSDHPNLQVKFGAEEQDPFADVGQHPGTSIVDQSLARERWLWHWADEGFTTFRVSHSYGAALIMTDTQQQGDLLLPWRCIRVEVPAGLLATELMHVRWLYLQALEGQQACLSMANMQLHRHVDDDVRHGATYRSRVGSSLAEVLWSRTNEEADFLDGSGLAFASGNRYRVDGDLQWQKGSAPFANEDKTRLMLLACNLMAGLLYTLQHTADWRATEHKHRLPWSTVRGRRAPPTHRNVVCGRAIAVNLTPAVHALARGETRKTMPAMFQSLVRGHYKRQVIGVGRGGRKVIWVEPYWRGPEGAPMLVRPYRFEMTTKM